MREIAVDQDRDAAERAQAAELVIAEEGRDRVDLVGEALEVQHAEHLADVGADEAADDLHGSTNRVTWPILRPGRASPLP